MARQPEFDQYSASYEDLLRSPIRDRFMGADNSFFHRRKWELLTAYFRERGVATAEHAYLDIGCGKGDLMKLFQGQFRTVQGCDPSAGMLQAVSGLEVRQQTDPLRLPFEAAQFDFATAVCVYHHVPVEGRAQLTREAFRVMRPGGLLAIIEHNPRNPVTAAVVKRTPVDVDAILLTAAETRQWMEQAGFLWLETQYFLYLPSALYRWLGGLERWLKSIPAGGQYAVFARRPG